MYAIRSYYGITASVYTSHVPAIGAALDLGKTGEDYWQPVFAGYDFGKQWIADRQSGPLLLRFGTEAQREAFLPRIVRGEIFFSIGMSEPDSGSDLASVRTRATPTDGGWRLNGQKVV